MESFYNFIGQSGLANRWSFDTRQSVPPVTHNGLILISAPLFGIGDRKDEVYLQLHTGPRYDVICSEKVKGEVYDCKVQRRANCAFLRSIG